MINVLARMKVCEWYAHKLHYNAIGQSFYGLHLLSDTLDFGDNEDNLKERYYLGEIDKDVPDDYEIAKIAMDLYTPPNAGEECKFLCESCKNLAYVIEEFRRVSKPAGGVCAALDDVSGTALTVAGLCARTIYERNNDCQ